jgi:hypothetical protein
MSKPPLRPATPIDAELADTPPNDDTEIGKVEKLGEENKEPPRREKDKRD